MAGAGRLTRGFCRDQEAFSAPRASLIVGMLWPCTLRAAQEPESTNRRRSLLTCADHQRRPHSLDRRRHHRSAQPRHRVVADLFQTGINTPEEWGRTPSGMGKRYLEREADVAISNTIEAGLGALWGEDPRYIPSGRHGIRARWHYALKTAVLAQRRDGRLAPAWGRYAGNIFNNLIENTWLPPSATTPAQTAIRSASGIGSRILGNLWEEFWPEVRKRFRKYPDRLQYAYEPGERGARGGLGRAALLCSALLHAQTPHAVVVDQTGLRCRVSASTSIEARNYQTITTAADGTFDLAGEPNDMIEPLRRFETIRCRASKRADRAADRARERGHGRRLRAHLVRLGDGAPGQQSVGRCRAAPAVNADGRPAVAAAGAVGRARTRRIAPHRRHAPA